MLSAFSQAWASWKSAPGVALLAVVAFAVGIGSTTAIFTVVNGVLLRPLPYPGGERFVALYGVNTTDPNPNTRRRRAHVANVNIERGIELDHPRFAAPGSRDD